MYNVLISKGSDTFCFHVCLFGVKNHEEGVLWSSRVLPWIGGVFLTVKRRSWQLSIQQLLVILRMRFLCKITPYLNASNRKMAHHPRSVLQRNSMQIPTNGLTKNDPNRFCQETTGSKICFVFCSTGCSNFSGGKTLSRPVWWEVINARARR